MYILLCFANFLVLNLFNTKKKKSQNTLSCDGIPLIKELIMLMSPEMN